MVQIAQIRKTISLEPALYNEIIRKMRVLRIDDFSKFVRYVLREFSDPAIIARGIAREHQLLASFYMDKAEAIEETRSSDSHVSPTGVIKCEH